MDGAGCRVKEDNEFTLARLELFHMKPGGVHPWHLPAPYFRHGMFVSATIGSTKVTFNPLGSIYKDKTDSEFETVIFVGFMERIFRSSLS